MISLNQRMRWLAAALAGLAGFVDAVGILETKGFFLSFMSGNSTRLGVGIAELDRLALVPIGLIIAFVAGVTAGSLLGRLAPTRRVSAVLFLVGAALVGAGILAWTGFSILAIGLAAAAMGAENTAFEADGSVRFGLTYMTGTLVKLGQGLAASLAGEGGGGWLPYLLHWTSLMVGAVVGASLQPLIGPFAFFIAGALALALAMLMAWPKPSQG